jgi:hypothetical protein
MTDLIPQLESSLSFARELNALKEQNSRLYKALVKYGWHDIKTCDATNSNGVRYTDKECTCGFDAALTNKVPA